MFLKVGEHSSSDDGDTKINIQDRIEQNAARVLARQRIANESSATQDVCVLAVQKLVELGGRILGCFRPCLIMMDRLPGDLLQLWLETQVSAVLRLAGQTILALQSR